MSNKALEEDLIQKILMGSKLIVRKLANLNMQEYFYVEKID